MSITPQQQNVYNMILQGMTNKQIAQRLRISESTIKMHTTHILKFYGAKNRVQLVAFHKGGAVSVPREIPLEAEPIAWVYRRNNKVIGMSSSKPTQSDGWEPVYLEDK